MKSLIVLYISYKVWLKLLLYDLLASLKLIYALLINPITYNIMYMHNASVKIGIKHVGMLFTIKLAILSTLKIIVTATKTLIKFMVH